MKLFLERYEASERLELEQQKDDKEAGGSPDGTGSQEVPAAEQEDEEAEEQGMKWRLIEDKQLERQRRGRHRPLQLLGESCDFYSKNTKKKVTIARNVKA